ncbi:uncharacterized protein LOC6599661 [Drosophila persimilis]|uniref:Uncharacterized protein n=1 Tax=Drosophila pseudoobscura pseudoobscura TaxID=46245 RepID=A0A6I8W4Y4_DROPS|nr:uncharacterized protein LOC6599661 [Drosophila persimilis]XP_033238393.1 uncharacterized protein LOC4812085 [Drosophila pseudoobscura]
MSETARNNPTRKGEETVSYALYLHRQELGRPKRRLMRIAGTKLQLTNELILLQQRRQWAADSPAELVYQQRSALNRESMYRDRLWRNMQRQLEKQHHRQRLNLQQMGKL